jgi:hypothetical protein
VEEDEMSEMWDLWIPSVGATGLSFARSRVEADAAGDRVLVHAAPQQLNVSVRSTDDGSLLAEGTDLERGEPGPMSFLVRDGREIRLEDGWPSDDDLGRLVILPGGEAGILTAWWNADDQSSWRWSVEFFNAT